MRRAILGLFGALCIAGAARASGSESVTKYVDPFIGTDGTGHTFPGASVPFAMVAPGPDNADTGWDYASGYQYKAPKIMGFSNTHISGAGIGEFGDVLIQPAQGTAWNRQTSDFSSSYDKGSETARPGYYAVYLKPLGVRAELTASRTTALHRYTFDQSGQVQTLVDIQHVIRFLEGPRILDSDVKIDARKGEISGRYRVKNWVDRETAFVLKFDHPIAEATFLPAKPGEHAPRYLLNFNLGAGRVLEARIALSTVDVAGARRNLASHDGATFNQVRRAADLAWNRLLRRAQIEAGPQQKRIFYTALYHALLHPSDIADVDGRVRGPTGQVISAPGGQYDSTLSLWDDVRATYPLLALIAPERINGLARTLLLHQRAMGYLPLWTAWGRENWCMIGNPALIALAEFMAYGFDGFNHDEAIRAMVATSTQPRKDVPQGVQTGWSDYEAYGYLPFDLASGESVSKTIEYAWGDDAVARAAALHGDKALSARFAARSQSWRKLFDHQTMMVRGRSSKGEWRTPFDPTIATSPLNNPGDYTEADAWQYTVAIGLFDPEGFVRELGGRKAAGEWLDRFFTTPSQGADRHLGQEAMIGQYAHGNEPSHHVAYLYAWTDRPWRTRQIVEQVAQQFYSDAPNGLTGNDDAGQMSAWYVLSTLGLYPEAPASGAFVLGAPLARRATLNTGHGRRLVIRRLNAARSERDTASATLDGAPVTTNQLGFGKLSAGGRLELRYEAKD